MRLEYQSRHAGEEDHLYTAILIHRLTNTFTPVFIPWLDDVANEVKAAMRRNNERATARLTDAVRSKMGAHPRQSSRRAGNASDLGLDSAAALAQRGAATPMHMACQVNVETFIFNVTCEPISAVNAKLQTEAGSILFVSHPQTHGWDVSARLDDLTLGLRHRSSGGQDSMQLAVDSLFVAYTSKRMLPTDAKPRASAVIDLPELRATVRMRQLEDWFYFNAIWVDPLTHLGDRGTEVNGSPFVTSPVSMSPTSPAEKRTEPAKPVESTVAATQILTRIQTITAAVSMGDRLGSSTFTMETLVARFSDVDGVGIDISMHLDALYGVAEGRVSGDLQFAGIEFEATLRPKRKVDRDHLVAITLSSGEFGGAFRVDRSKVVVFQVKPMLASSASTAVLSRSDGSVADKHGRNTEDELTASLFAEGVRVVVTPLIMDLAQELSSEVQHSIFDARQRQQKEMAVVQAGPRHRRKVSLSKPTESPLGRQIASIDIDLGPLTIGAFEGTFEATSTNQRLMKIDIEGCRAVLQRDHPVDDITLLPLEPTSMGIHRQIHLQLGTLQLHLYTELKYGVPEFKRSLDDWINVKGQALRGLLIPTLSSDMNSYQTGLEVRHSFVVQIKGDFKPSLNGYFYAGLKDFVGNYRSSFDSARSSILATFAPAPTSPTATSGGDQPDWPRLEFKAARMQVDRVMLEFCRNAAATSLINRVLREDKWPTFVHNCA